MSRRRYHDDPDEDRRDSGGGDYRATTHIEESDDDDDDFSPRGELHFDHCALTLQCCLGISMAERRMVITLLCSVFQ